MVLNLKDCVMALEGPANSNIAADATHYHNKGTLHGVKQHGKSFIFDGVNDYIRIPDSLELRISSPFSVEALVYVAGGQGNVRAVISRMGVAGRWGYILRATAANIWEFGTDGPNVGLGWYISGGSLIPGQWYHLVGTYNNPNSVLYVNGENVASGSNVNSPGTNAFDVGVGIGSSDWSSFPWDGIIRAPRIYSYALSAAEVKKQYYRRKERWKNI